MIAMIKKQLLHECMYVKICTFPWVKIYEFFKEFFRSATEVFPRSCEFCVDSELRWLKNTYCRNKRVMKNYSGLHIVSNCELKIIKENVQF